MTRQQGALQLRTAPTRRSARGRGGCSTSSENGKRQHAEVAVNEIVCAHQLHEAKRRVISKDPKEQQRNLDPQVHHLHPRVALAAGLASRDLRGDVFADLRLALRLLGELDGLLRLDGGGLGTLATGEDLGERDRVGASQEALVPEALGTATVGSQSVASFLDIGERKARGDKGT